MGMGVTFTYKGKNAEGIESRGVVEAASKEDALAKLKLLESQGLRDIVIEGANATVSEQTTVLPPPTKPSKSDAEQKIDRLIKQGYVVQHRDEYRVQLVRRKSFSWFFFLLWLFLGIGIGAVLYLIYYWAKKDKVVTLNL